MVSSLSLSPPYPSFTSWLKKYLKHRVGKLFAQPHHQYCKTEARIKVPYSLKSFSWLKVKLRKSIVICAHILATLFRAPSVARKKKKSYSGSCENFLRNIFSYKLSLLVPAMIASIGISHVGWIYLSPPQLYFLLAGFILKQIVFTVRQMAAYKLQVSIFSVYQFRLDQERGFAHFFSTLPRNDSHWPNLSHMSIPEPITSQEEGMLWLAGTRSCPYSRIQWW